MSWQCKRNLAPRGPFIVTSVLFVAFFALSVLAAPPEPNTGRKGFWSRCAELISAVAGKLSTDSSPVAVPSSERVPQAPQNVSFEVRTLDDLLLAFASGYVPDLSKKSERDAFDIYLKMRFGSNTGYVNASTVTRVRDFLKSHPDVEKEPLHPVRVEALEKTYPVTPELEGLVKKQREAAGQVLSNLYQIEANLGFWRKLLQYEDPVQIPKEAAKDEKKRLQEESKKKFLAVLDQKVSPDLRKELAEGKLTPNDRAKKLYAVLKIIRDELSSQGKDIGPVSQAMVDLIHTVGFQDKAIAKILKEGDGLERLTAFRRALTERDNLAFEVGFPGHFAEALAALGVRMPTGVDSMANFEARLSEIEKTILESAVVKPGTGNTRWVRPLSLVEAPFRSCLGLDCSSSTWLTTGLNPNYQFYTWTDAEGHSTGQISLTMGEAQRDGKKVKVAFANKIQNISPADLPVFLEAVRVSLEADGYLLGIPEDLGERVAGSGGISNSTNIFDAVRRIGKSSDIVSNFKPHKLDQNYGYDKHTYDRSNLGLAMRVVLPLSANEGLQFSLGPKMEPWKPGEPVDLQRLVQASYELKNGTLEERMRYIPSMEAIQKAGLKVDPRFDEVLTSWVENPKEDFKLRKQVLIHYLMTDSSESFSQLLGSFTPADRATILQNIMDTPRYKTKLLEKRGAIPDLVASVRGSKKVREMLLLEFDKKGLEAQHKILDAVDIADAQIPDLIRAVKSGLRSTEIDKLVRLLELVQGTSVAEWFLSEIQVHFIENLSAPTLLSRALSTAMASSSVTAKEFAERLIRSEDPRVANTPIIRTYREIIERGGDFSRASQDWMRDQNVNADLKAEFLLSQSSPWAENYRRLEESIPKDQRQAVERVIDRRSTIRVYRELAKERGISSDQLAKTYMESFLLVDPGISKEGTKFTMGSPTTEEGRWGNNETQREVILSKPIRADSTHFTQLQYFLLTGKNPSRFVGDGEDQTITVRGVKIDPNRPVEQVNFDESVAAAKLLGEAVQKIGIKARPRLPTDAEWEYLARGKTDTPYFFGSDVTELENYAWFHGNSNSRTHVVASKPPNKNGMFDPVGQVWVWTADWYKEIAPGGKDPLVTERGSYRVIRGGSWGSDAQFLRSANRSYGIPESRYVFVGFRLVWDMPE